jgi:glycosyltransferase involved in cell wall biosynthesis
MAKTVLVLAFHFPPLGGPATQRNVHLVRLLSHFGYEPIVLTATPSTTDHWAPFDVSVEQKLAANIEIERIVVAESTPRALRIERLLALNGSYARRFTKEAMDLPRRLGGRVDVMLVEFGPYALARSAARLARALGVPWVADLQDPWALDEMWLYPTALHRLVDRRRMRRALSDAEGVIMNTSEAARRVLDAFPALPADRVAAIPNGYDAHEFPELPAPRNPRFRVVHTGSLHTELGLKNRRTARLRAALGGMPVPGVDFLTRSPVFLLQAVDRLLLDDPCARDDLEILFLGPTTAADRSVIEATPVSRWEGIRTHDETVAAIRSADLLFLPMQDLPAGHRAGLVPTKTYEYAASGRPILAAVPPGDARALLESLPTAMVVDPSDVDGMAERIGAALRRWRAGEPPPRLDRHLLSAFEYHVIARQVAGVLDSAIATASGNRPPSEGGAGDG